MITSILIFIIILLLINTLITNIQLRKLIKELEGENPNEFKDKIEEFKKERQKRQVQEALTLRHKLANEQLGITNSSKIDFDSPVFAQWVLANDWRKGVVTDFGDPQGFVDLLRGFLFEYPDEATGLQVNQPQETSSEQVQAEQAKVERRKTASSVISRKPTPERPKPKVNDPQGKAAYWANLTGG